jgi:hypothetical protein
MTALRIFVVICMKKPVSRRVNPSESTQFRHTVSSATHQNKYNLFV